MYRQPDRRIQKDDLGYFWAAGKKFVSNIRPGVPRNALIEVVNGSLRCWASHEHLDDDAAAFIEENAVYIPENNAFVWKPGFKPGYRKEFRNVREQNAGEAGR